MDVNVITDRTTTIRASVKDVEFELMLTIALVVMVIFLFLRSLSATIIPGIAVPLSLIGTFAVMYLLGYSLDNLSLMALTISTGFVVDDAIVMIENISRYLEMGDSADGGGAQRIGGNRIHHRIADRFADRGADSAAVHGGYRGPPVPRIRGHAGGHHHFLRVRFADADADDGGAHSEAQARARTGPVLPLVGVGVSSRPSSSTARWCGSCLRHQPTTLLVAVGTLALTIYLYIIVPKGFFPVQDTGVILGISQAPETDLLRCHGRAAAAAGARHPRRIRRSRISHRSSASTARIRRMNSGRIQITLKPLEEREGFGARCHPAACSRNWPQVPGITLYMQPVQDLTVEDRISRTQYQYALDAPDKDVLDHWIPKLVDKLKQIPELRDVASDQQNNGLGLQVDIDRDTAGRLGITPQNVDDALYDAFGQRQVSTIFTQSNQYHVILEAAPQWQPNADALQDIYVQIGSASQNLASTIALAGTNTALTGAAPHRRRRR